MRGNYALILKKCYIHIYPIYIYREKWKFEPTLKGGLKENIPWENLRKNYQVAQMQFSIPLQKKKKKTVSS